MTSDAKLAHTITASIAQVGSALRRSPLPSAQSIKDGCAAAVQTVKEAVDHLSKKHQRNGKLVSDTLEIGCRLFVQGDLAGAQRAITLALEGAQALEQEIAPIKAATLRGDFTMEGLDYLGQEDGTGDLASSIIKAIGGAAQGGINYAQNKKAAEASAAEIEARVKAAVAADKAATSANTKALVSELIAASNPAKAIDAQADRAAATAASAAQDAAGAAVPAAGRAKRIEAAQEAVSTAIANIDKSSGNAKQVAQFQLQAAQATLAKAQQQIPAGAGTSLAVPPAQPSDDEGFLGVFTKKLGPLPRYAYVLIAGGAFVGYKVLSSKENSK